MVSGLGYTVLYRASEEAQWRHDVKATDLVVIAGGDGTVAKVIVEMRGSPTPVAVLPFGTANNIARTFGIPTANPLGQLGAGHARSRWCDVPCVEGAGQLQPFVETVGSGLFADLLAQDDEADQSEGNDGGLRRLQRLLDLSLIHI